jgi:tetratricopeptide (TPR) repeat protein
MFDENTDEALKYAIPLDSPYLNRGTADPSSRLGSHTTDFDLGKLGGGRQTDSWNVHSSYYHDLRNKYQRAAQKEMEAKDFKKAAYIYAHLLGDFQSAANVLEQGKHYREAAVLYKDHLNNMPAAAGCLERGGLLLEAIDLYDQLHKYEKVGDLYGKMEQPENAEKYYEQSIDHLLANKDYLDASRIMQEKIKNPDRALETLFKGWTDSRQSESCLMLYVSMQYEKDAAKAVSGLQDIYEHHTPPYKKNQFLNVLTYINEKENNADLLDTSRTIAYEIISEELSKGKLSNLPTLQKFLPEDPLITSDCSRFNARSNTRPAEPSSAAEVLQLDKGVKWITAVVHRSQFLVLGIKNARLQLARGNWYGHLEYCTWNDHIKVSDYFMLITDPLRSNRVLLHTSGGIALEEKKLPKNKYFDEELLVFSPTWLSKGYSGISFNSQGGITALAATNHKLSLHHYTMEVFLQHTLDGQFEGKAPMLLASHYLSEMIYRNGFYYTFQENLFMKISEEGIIRHTDVGAIISTFAASTHYAKFRIALATDQGCLLMRQVGGELKPAHDFFAQNLEPVDIRFISASNLVVAGKHKAVVYEIQEDSVKARQTFESGSPIVAILPTADRHQIALLEDNGKIAIHLVVQG